MRNVLQFIRRFLGRIALLLNIGAMLWLLLCLAAAYVHPDTFRYIGLFTLSTPIAILANIFFSLFWLIFSTRKLRALLSVATLLVCYKLVGMIWGMSYFKTNDMAAGSNRLKVLHWNAHGMGIFENGKSSQHERKMMDYIFMANADIVCLPEFATPKEKIMTPAAKAIMRHNKYVDYRFQADNTLGKTIFLGTAVFSKYPISRFKANKLSDYIYMLQGDVAIAEGDTMRMFFVHLSTFGLSDNDKNYIEEISKAKNNVEADMQRSRSYMWKFNYTFLRHAREVALAKSIIDESPYPVIICGDFNDLPASYTYTRFTQKLDDAFRARGKGLGRTYNRLSPTLRIDYIFYDPKALKCVGYESSYTTLSDHNPVIANFEILNRK